MTVHLPTTHSSAKEEFWSSAWRPPDADQVNQLLMGALSKSGIVSGQCSKVTGPVRRGENSYVFRAEVLGLQLPMAVKLCLDPKTHMPSPASARRQFDALRRVHEHLGNNPDYGIPEPVPLLTEQGYLVMDWIQGRSLTDLLLDLRIRSRDLLPLIGRAGTWLRHLHDCHLLSAQPLHSTQLLNGLQEALEDAGPLVANDPVARRAIDMLTQLVEPLECYRLPRAWLHGDFSPDNLMVSEQRLIGVDTALRFENVVVMDLVSFLTRLNLLCYHPRGLRLLPLRGSMADSFIAGYVGAGPAIPPLALNWVQLYSAMTVWATRLPQIGTGPKRLYAGHCFRRLARQFCSDLQVVSGQSVGS